jgi:hypothetical protein
MQVEQSGDFHKPLSIIHTISMAELPCDEPAFSGRQPGIRGAGRRRSIREPPFPLGVRFAFPRIHTGFAAFVG